MYIKKMELTNIKKYDYKEVEFKPGLNFISGRNGAGKTTIIESIGFALFDYTISSKNFSSYFIKKGEKKGEVKVYITDKNGNDLIVDRKISMTNAGNSWSVTNEGESIAIVSGNVEVLNYLKENLEFYPDDNITDIYSSIISVPQGEFTQAFFYSEKPRREVFDPIFKLDTYRKAYNNIKLLKNLEDEINDINQNKAVLIGEVKEYDNIIESIKNEKAEEKNIKAELTMLEALSKDMKKKYDALKEKREKVEIIKNEIAQINIEYEKKLTLLDTKKKYYDEILKLKKTLEDNKKEYDLYTELEKKIELNENRVKELKANKDLSETKKQGIEKGKIMIEERNNSLKLQEEDIKKDEVKLNEYDLKIKEYLKKIEEDSSKEADNESVDNAKSKFENLKLSKDKFIDNIYKYENVKKQIELNLKMQTMPGKDLMYLNSAKKNILEAKKKSEGEVINYLDRASDNIECIVKLKSEEGKLTSSGTDELLTQKEQIETAIINIYNKFITDKIDNISDIDGIKENFINYYSNFEKGQTQELEQNTKTNVEYNHILKVNNELIEEINKKKERLEKEKTEKAHWEKGIEDYKEIVKSLESDVVEYDKLLKIVDEDKTKMKTLKSSYEMYVSNLKKVEEEGKVKDEITSTEKELIVSKEKIEECNNKISQIAKDYNEEEYEKTRIDYESNNTKVQIINEKLSHITKMLSELNDKKLHLEEVKEKIKSYEKDIIDYKEAYSIISKLRDVIKTAPDEISNMLIKNIGNRAADIYSDIALDSNKLVWENSYEIALYDYRDDKEIRKTFKELSGGEQMTAALAVRIAMLEILTKIKLGILDEPTVNMDTIRREKLSEIIGSISEKFKQLIVVSHDDTFENITQNVISLTQ